MTEDDLLERVRLAWAEVLDLDTVDSVPLDVNFLEAGGNSLMLVMLWEELHELTSQMLKMSDLFEHGTVRAQTNLLAGNGNSRSELAEVGAGDRGRLLGRARREAATGTQGPSSAD